MSTCTEIAMEVAVSAVATMMAGSTSTPSAMNTKYPTKNGAMTPIAPTVNDGAPSFMNSLGVVFMPATNRMMMAAISPMWSTVSSRTTRG